MFQRPIFISLTILSFILSCNQSVVNMTNTHETYRQRFQYSRDIEINFEIHGQGPHTLLLIHGYGASLESWRDIQPFLVDSFTLYLIDLKGFGLSSKPNDGAYSIEDQAEIVVSFIKHHKLKNFILGGQSYGGGVALVTYFKLQDIKNHKRVNALLLIDSAGYLQKFPFFISILRVPVLNRIILKGVPAYFRARYTLKRLFFDKTVVTRKRIERYARFFDLPGSHNSFIEVAKQIVPNNPDAIIKRIPKIRIPTLILWGDNDPVIPREHGHRFNKEIQNSKLEVIQECGHVPHEEKPEETSEFITKFFKNLD